MGKRKSAKGKKKAGGIKIKQPKKLKEPDKKNDSATNFFWAIKVLKKVANKPIDVSPQNLREVLAKSPHAVATWAGKNAILNVVQLMREDLLYILIEAGAIIQPPGTQTCENDFSEDGNDGNAEAKALTHAVVVDASVCAFLSKCADFTHNKLNDLLREADSADAVKALLTVGAQPNYFGSYGCTAVHEAAYSGRPVCLFTLLQRGGLSFTRSAEGRTPLHAAAIGGNVACVKVLISAGVNVGAVDYCSMTALHFAAGSSRSAECVPPLVAAGANVNAKDKFDMTPLHYAAAYGTAETVKVLLDEGADRDALDQWFRTPGHTVYSECDSRERKEARAPIYWLLNPEGGGDEQTWDNIEEDYIWDEEPPLPTSKQSQHDVNVLRQLACFGDVTLKEIKILLNRSSPLVSSYSACKALQTCAEMGRREIINIFLKKGASPHIRESDFCSDEVFEPFVDPGYLTSSCNDWPLIHIAAAAGQVQTVETLLAAKASKKRVWVAEYPDPFGPLEAAAANGHLTMVKYLLFSGCVTDREQLDGALRLAVTPKGWQAGCKNWVEETQTRIARTLLDAGADPSARDVFGHTPVHGATCCGWTKCLSLLIRRGSNVMAETVNGKTALHTAAGGRHTVCLSLLIKAGASVSSKDCLGQTPLHYVAEGWTPGDWTQTQSSMDDGAEIVKALVDAGADVHCPDKNGVTALHLAAKSGSLAVVEGLLNAGALVNAKDRNSRTPLHYAADAGADHVVDKLIKSGADASAKDHSGHIPHAKLNSVSSVRSDTERNLENEDSEESDGSWCGICGDDEWVEVVSSDDDTDDWELEYYRWVKELCKRSRDKRDGEEVVENQLTQNTESKQNKDKQLEQNILLKSVGEVETESEDDGASDEGDASDDGEEVDDFRKMVKNREKISKLSIKWRLRGYVDSDTEFESLPDEDSHLAYLPAGAVSDAKAPWYNKKWIKGENVCNEDASQKPSEVESKTETDCEMEGKVDLRLKDSPLSETDHCRKVKRETEKGRKECEEGQGNSVQDTKVLLIKQEGASQRDETIKDEHKEYAKELRIKVELDDDENDDKDACDEQNVPYVSGAWTIPQQSEKVVKEKNDLGNRTNGKWRSGEGSSRTLEFPVESDVACWRAGRSSRSLLGREEEEEKNKNEERRSRGSVWLRLGKRSSDSDSDSHHNGIVVTTVLTENDEGALRYVQENSLEKCETRRKEYKRQVYDQQSRFVGESKERERYQGHEQDSLDLEEKYSHGLQNEEVIADQQDESFTSTEHWVRVCYESGEQTIYVQDSSEDSETRDEQNASGDLHNWCERPLETGRGWCNEDSLEERQTGTRSNSFEVRESAWERERQYSALSDEGYGRETFETHGEEGRWFGIEVERGQGFETDQAKHEENEWKPKKVQNAFRHHPEEDATEKLRGWEAQIIHTSIRTQVDQKKSCQNEGSSRDRSYGNCDRRSVNSPENLNAASSDWEGQDLLDRQQRQKRRRSHERVSYERGTQRGFGERCKELERVSEERGNKTFEYEDRPRKEQHDYHRSLDAHENKASCSTPRIYEHELRGFRKLGDRGQDGYHYQAGSNEEECDRPHCRYRLSEPDRMRSHSQYSDQEQNILHRYGAPIEQDRIQSQYRNAGEDDPCKLLLVQEHHPSREHVHEKTHSPYDRIGRQEHNWSMEHASDIVGSQHSGNWEKKSQDRLEERGYGRSQSPRSRCDEQEHYRSISYSRQELEKNSQTTGRGDVVSHSQIRLEENAFKRLQSPKSRYDEQEHYRSSSYGRQESEKYGRIRRKADEVLQSQSSLEEHAYERSQSPSSRYNEQDHYRSTRYRRQELENRQTSGRANVVSHSQSRLEENAFGRSQSPKSRYDEREHFRSTSYDRQESEKYGQIRRKADEVLQSQSSLEEHAYERSQSPSSRYNEQDHYRSTRYRRQELENHQTSGRANVVSHSQSRLEENALGRSQSPKSRYDEREHFRSTSYDRQESEKYGRIRRKADEVLQSQSSLEEHAYERSQSPSSRYNEQDHYRSTRYRRQELENRQTSGRANVVSHSQSSLEENALGRLQSPKSRYDEREHYRSTSYGRQESEKNGQARGQAADILHNQGSLEDHVYGRSQSHSSRYDEQDRYRSTGYDGQKCEKKSQRTGRADNGSCSPHGSRIRFTERKSYGTREREDDRSGSLYSDQEHEKFHSYYTSRKLSHRRSRSPFGRLVQQERDRSDTHDGRQGSQLYNERRSRERAYDRSRSPCRRASDETRGRLRENKGGEMEHDRSRIQYSGSDERGFRSHTHGWPDILKDVPH